MKFGPVLDVAKKNVLSVIFLVVAILAVVANFYPMGGKRETLKTEATEHAANAEKLKALLTKPRTIPVVTPGSSESQPLPGFPTKQAVEEGHKATDQVNKAADNIYALASGTLNAHTPLVAGALPGTPGDTLPQSQFAREYVGMFPPLVLAGQVAAVAPAPAPRRPGAPPTLMEILHAQVPPTDIDLTNARTEKQKSIEAEYSRFGPNGSRTNDAEVTDLITQAFKSLADTMRTDRAKAAKVYVAPDAFAMYPGMTVQAQPAPSEVFWAQIGLWTQEDICHAIFEMNDSSPNVMEAPVKQLVRIAFVTPGTQSQGAAPGLVPVFLVPGLTPSGGVGTNAGSEMATMPQPGVEGATPAVPPMDPAAEMKKNPVMSPTGRVSNGLFDVEHFSVELIVDAGKVPLVLEGLGNKRYISVIQVESIEPVDSSYMRGAGYYFGTKPCVKIRARCEEIFFRSWLATYVPAQLKTILGYPAPTPPPA